ncbi:40S ribosomal protein S8-B [Fusarium oxysporum f. sp. raphani]|uniref:40S ribosomal protein S8 n=1 Tax=Fusarium oxysporum f. sp. raphani TaxID=96318 RepID=A0A8J5QBU4_FUSOX|nr:40S ribosomal protein S8-B [Fusarium oxysporum f. sp. raphani]
MTSVPVGKDRQLLSAVCSDDSTQEEVKKELRKAADYSKTKGFIPTRQAQNSQDFPRLVRGAKINLKRETAPQEENKARETHKLVDPLQNAPRGPSSAHQLPQTFSSTVKQALNLNRPESGSWSQSKRWTSFATKERQAFQKTMANLRYMSADQSPFVPQSPVELTAFKANLAESKTRKLDQEVKQRLARTNASVDEGVETQVKPMMKLLRGKKFKDCLSPVFAASNCFNTSRNQPPYDAGWPTLTELKEEGDKRSSRQGRCLPLPRLDLVSRRLSSEISEACSSDGAVRNDKRTVQVGSRYLCPVTPEEPSITPPIELQSEEAPLILATLLQSINAAEDDAKRTEEDNEKTIGQEHEEKAEEKGATPTSSETAIMGISRDSRHKRSASGAKRAYYRKKRAFEAGRQGANTRIGPKRIHTVRTRGGNHKYRALRLDSGNFAWGSEGLTRKTRVIAVAYHPSNNELVRTNTLTKSAVVQVDAAPFRQWYEAHYGQAIGRRRQKAQAAKEGKTEEEVKKSNAVEKKQAARLSSRGKVESAIEKQFEAGRLYAVVSSRPGQSGRVDGYILEGEELAFYQRKLHK